LNQEQTKALKLSGPHQEVLKLVANGYTNYEIGKARHIELSTVNKYLKEIRWCLDIQERVSLAIFAIRSGLVRIEELELH